MSGPGAFVLQCRHAEKHLARLYVLSPMMRPSSRGKRMVALSDPPARSVAGAWIGWPIFLLAVASRVFALSCALIAAQHIVS
jgi:hypothetical protein